MQKIDELDAFAEYLKGDRESEYVNRRQEIIAEVVKGVNREKDDRKKENWKRYCNWCRENKLSDTDQNRELFKESKYFLTDIDYKKMNGILRRYTEDQIESLHKEALQANNYAKYFFWRIKQINEERKQS